VVSNLLSDIPSLSAGEIYSLQQFEV
jgi:hypothetical protein